jgi:hypothetical protein
MYAFRKNIAIYLITGMGVLGLLNVSVQFGRIIDFFPGISMSLLLAEELVETEGCEKGNEAFTTVDLFLAKETYVIQNLVVNHAVEVYLHSIDIPVHPAFEKATPPPKA